MKGLDADTEASMLEAKGNWDLRINKANNEFQEALQTSELSAQTTQLLMNQTSEAMTQAQISMQNLMGDSEFLNDMGAADEAAGLPAGTSIKNYMNRIIGQSTSGIKLSAQAAGLYTPKFQADLANMIEGIVW